LCVNWFDSVDIGPLGYCVPSWTKGIGYDAYRINRESGVNGEYDNCANWKSGASGASGDVAAIGACSWVWGPIGHLWYDTSANQRDSQTTATTLLNMLYNHYAQAPPNPQNENCSDEHLSSEFGGDGGETCLQDVLLPALAAMGYSGSNLPGDWTSLFSVGGGDGSLLWWAQSLYKGSSDGEQQAVEWADHILEWEDFTEGAFISACSHKVPRGVLG
jgi:hypothetical protein